MTELNQDLAALRIERAPERPGVGRWAGWLVLVILVGVGGYFGWTWFTRDQPIEVQTATVTERAAGAQAVALQASGYVTARRQATVSSKVTGKVIEVNVEEGMRVQAGQVLARLDDTQPRAALALAEAQAQSARQNVRENEVHLAQARTTLDRQSKLLAAGFGTQADVDAAKLDMDSTDARIGGLQQMVKVAEQSVEVQKAELDNTIIRAPFTGIATTKNAQPGEMVSPVSAGGGFTRTGICTIVDMSSLEIDVDVNENYIGQVKNGQAVTAVLNAYPDWQIPAHVITVVPTADRQKATVLVRIGINAMDPRILPDMGIKVTFLRPSGDSSAVATRPVTLIPKAAVVKAGNDSFVFVVTGETVERRAVRIGGTDGDRLEAVGSLRMGDKVVLSPPATLKSGDKVTTKG
jgi:RND family efflux transporter MFP subunit